MKRLKPSSRETLEKASPGEGTWAISYGDMITLLLAFFILFFSVSPPEDDKSIFTSSMVAALLALDEQTAAGSGSESGMFGEVVVEKRDTSSGSDPADQDRWNNQIQQTIAKLAGVLGLGPAVSQTEQVPAPPSEPSPVLEVKALGAHIHRVQNKVYISFPEVSFFDSASTDLTQHGKEVLQRFNQNYLPYAGKNILNIVGFSDPRPVRSEHRFRDNLELSVLRAVSAQRHLEELGIPLARTRLMGHGVKQAPNPENMPLTQTEILALSRKIMLIIEPGEESL